MIDDSKIILEFFAVGGVFSILLLIGFAMLLVTHEIYNPKLTATTRKRRALALCVPHARKQRRGEICVVDNARCMKCKKKKRQK